MDNGGIIKIPQNHVWVECENPHERSLDSLTDFGPISKKYIVGLTTRIVWPLFSYSLMTELEKYKPLLDGLKHSKAYTNQEVYDKYGLLWLVNEN